MNQIYAKINVENFISFMSEKTKKCLIDYHFFSEVEIEDILTLMELNLHDAFSSIDEINKMKNQIDLFNKNKKEDELNFKYQEKNFKHDN